MQELAPGTWKIGFLVENYVHSLIPRSKLANPGQHTSKLVLLMFSKKTWSRLEIYLLGPNKSDASLKTTHIVLFPGLNSQIQVDFPI